MTDSSASDRTDDTAGSTAGATFTFAAAGTFEAMMAAEDFLSDLGLSVGRCQRGSPRGIMHGDWDIQKWRNLRAQDKAMLDGVMTGDMRHGPVTVTIFSNASDAAKSAIAKAPAVTDQTEPGCSTPMKQESR